MSCVIVTVIRLLDDLRKQVNELQKQHQTENAVPGIQHAAPPIPDHDEFGVADGPSPQQSPPLGYYADQPMDLHNHEQEPLGAVTPDHTGISNPLVSDQPDYLTISGRLRYLGHTSSWSFTQQVLRMAHGSPHTRHISRVLNYVEGEAYTIPQVQPIAIIPADVTGLPSLSLSQLYVQTVCFRTYPLFHLFDEADFRSSLLQFYKSPIDYAHQRPLWFVQYLVVMAMGKALAHPGPAQRIENGEGPGSQLFARALKLLPSVLYLWTDPVLSTEIFCCMALYLQSVDHRAAASISVRRYRDTECHADMCNRLVRLCAWHRGMVCTPTSREPLWVTVWSSVPVEPGGRYMHLIASFHPRSEFRFQLMMKILVIHSQLRLCYQMTLRVEPRSCCTFVSASSRGKQ